MVWEHMIIIFILLKNFNEFLFIHNSFVYCPDWIRTSNLEVNSFLHCRCATGHWVEVGLHYTHNTRNSTNANLLVIFQRPWYGFAYLLSPGRMAATTASPTQLYPADCSHKGYSAISLGEDQSPAGHPGIEPGTSA